MVQYIGKINKDIYRLIATNDILTDEVIITDTQIKHIIQRRGLQFYDEYSSFFSEIISNPDYIFKDKSENTAIVSKTFYYKNRTIHLVVRLAIKGENETYKNSIITAILENQRRFEQRLRNTICIYKRLDKIE